MSRKKIKPSRSRLVPSITVAEATQIGATPGVLAIRTGMTTKSPTVVVVPAESLEAFSARQQAATRAAEEEYWNLQSTFYAGARSDDNWDLERARVQWLRALPWRHLLQTPDVRHQQGLFFMARAGHVALLAPPPHAAARTLVIFDPLQIRRLEAGFAKASTRARQQLPKACPDIPRRLDRARREWSSYPWPGSPYTPPTPEQAEETIHKLRGEFLLRTSQTVEP